MGSGVKLPKDWISEHASASVGQLTWPEGEKKKAPSRKLQAASDLTLVPRYYRISSGSRLMVFRSVNLPNHTLAPGGTLGPAQPMEET